MSNDARRLAWLLLGVALLQAAWIWVLPPFGGLDEVDHAYRAASVARGHLVDRQSTEDGRGDLILVPKDVVSAAHFRCDVLAYTGPANCSATDHVDASGQVHVASAAATYNPSFYVIAGVAALPFNGTGALYAMRVATALLCDVFLGLALWIGLRCSRSAWPSLGILVAATPVLLCATATAAPNGPEMSASLALWCAGAALLAHGRPVPVERRLLRAGCIAGSVVIVTHTTGLLWVVGTVVALVTAMGPARAQQLWHDHRLTLLRCGAVLTSIALSAGAWILTQHTNNPTADSVNAGSVPWGTLAVQPVLWVLQTIGAVPMRDQPAPVPVFVLGLLLFATLIVLGIRKGTPSVRRAMGLVAVACLVVPLVATIATYDALGFAWQGRYELPLGYGLLVLAAWSMGTWLPRRFGAAVAPIVVVAVTLMQLIAVVHVRSLVAWTSQDGGHPPDAWLLLLFAALSGAALLLGVVRRPGADRVSFSEQRREVLHA